MTDKHRFVSVWNALEGTQEDPASIKSISSRLMALTEVSIDMTAP